MKRSYPYVDKSTVRDAKAIAKILIRNTYDKHGEVTEQDINPICLIVCQVFDARYLQFILDFKEWIGDEIVKFKQKH